MKISDPPPPPGLEGNTNINDISAATKFGENNAHFSYSTMKV